MRYRVEQNGTSIIITDSITLDSKEFKGQLVRQFVKEANLIHMYYNSMEVQKPLDMYDNLCYSFMEGYNTSPDILIHNTGNTWHQKNQETGKSSSLLSLLNWGLTCLKKTKKTTNA